MHGGRRRALGGGGRARELVELVEELVRRGEQARCGATSSSNKERARRRESESEREREREKENEQACKTGTVFVFWLGAIRGGKI
jgi:hypothetical protein